MKKILLHIILFFLTTTSFTQNLVHNPSMEEYYDCYQPYTHMPENAKYWWDPTKHSSDYLNECHNNNVFGTVYGIPQNIYGYQWARTGKAYMFFGIALKQVTQHQYYGMREHIAVGLKDSLIIGKEYCVQAYVSLPELFYYGIDDIGFLFTKDSINFPAPPPPVNQLMGEIPQVTNFQQNVLTDTINWVKIVGSFIATEKYYYLIIGSFTHDTLISYIFTNTSTPYKTSGYYIDDVSVYPCDAQVYEADGGEDIELCYGDSVELGTHDLADYLYWWYDESGNLIDSSGYTTVSPAITTTYKLVVKDFKFEETVDYVTVYVEDCATFVPNIFSPNRDGNNDVLYVLSNYIQSMQFVVYNRWGEKVFETKNINEGWNGKYNGEACSPGVYVWYLEAVLLNGETIKRKGNVSLVR